MGTHGQMRNMLCRSMRLVQSKGIHLFTIKIIKRRRQNNEIMYITHNRQIHGDDV